LELVNRKVLFATFGVGDSGTFPLAPKWEFKLVDRNIAQSGRMGMGRCVSGAMIVQKEIFSTKSRKPSGKRIYAVGGPSVSLRSFRQQGRLSDFG